MPDALLDAETVAEKKIGRPTIRTEENANAILNRLTEGESLSSITSDEGMPSYAVVSRWLISDEDFRKRYILAREAQAEKLADEILDIADDGTNDFYEKEGVELPDHENIQRSRLRVDARKWVAAKLLPKKYGDQNKAGDIHLNQSVNNFLVLSVEKQKELQDRHRRLLEG